MSWPAKTPPSADAREKRTLGKGVFRKCDGCAATFDAEVLAATFEVCPSCGHHHRLGHERWRELLLDDGVHHPWDEHLAPTDPLQFVDGVPYPVRVASARKRSGADEAIATGGATIEGQRVAFGLFVFGFLGGSMGSVVGERLARLFERAIHEHVPVVVAHTSGGARMQEGILSLLQMAKIVGAREKLRDARLPFLSLLLDPTTGGVAASTALIGDVNVAEPGAQIGFAGPRVIEATLRTTLPEGFQRAEFLVAHGMVDLIAPRPELKATVAALLRHLHRERPARGV